MKPILAISILFEAVSSLLAKEESAPLPPPVSDKIYTFQQIEKQKAQLKDKVIRIEIESLVAGPGDTLADGIKDLEGIARLLSGRGWMSFDDGGHIAPPQFVRGQICGERNLAVEFVGHNQFSFPG